MKFKDKIASEITKIENKIAKKKTGDVKKTIALIKKEWGIGKEWEDLTNSVGSKDYEGIVGVKYKDKFRAVIFSFTDGMLEYISIQGLKGGVMVDEHTFDWSDVSVSDDVEADTKKFLSVVKERLGSGYKFYSVDKWNEEG